MSDTILNQTGTVLAYEAYSEIRQMIGNDVALRDIFTEERIKSCSGLIDRARRGFFEVTRTELNMLDQFAAAPVVAESEGRNFVAAIAAHAGNIKGQAEMLGFSLIARICTQIIYACTTGQQRQDLRRQLIVKMVETLRLAYREEITDDGGPVGQELLVQLNKILGTMR